VNVHGINDVKRAEMHTSEQLVPETSSFKVQITIEKQKRYKLSHIDQIMVELVKAGGNTLCFDIHKHINSI
jgi:hypothetical protein